ncbi:hypothetical protein BT67DRAFT_372328 [Trichocladium antarcticum]|uniref:Transcription factor Iwr1 domain-containing protein n=1 Tax=Trichocladium antarcticum TaxID=1450529 RepID=A0AAN6UR84_9PEZI|nr:hypothetical protein BT67DRAFT_372328 [Trichocladium antarcticum]
MAGLPPDTIHVKRKRGTEDGPVDFLRLERSKRYRSQSGDGSWIYRRKQPTVGHDDHAADPSVPAIPTIRPTQEGDEGRLLRGPHKSPHASLPSDTAAPDTPRGASSPKAPASRVFSHPNTDRIRRFHLSRSNSPQPVAAGVSKKRTVPAVFIERGSKKQRELLQAIIQEDNIPSASTSQTVDDSRAATTPSPTAQEPPAAADQQPNTIKYRRPGTKARAVATATTRGTETTASTESKPTLPPSLRDREGAGAHGKMDELARVMDSWTIAEITKNLDRIDEQANTSKYSPAKSRFRPKPPKQRYFERHPSAAAAQQTTSTPTPASLPPGMDIDTGDTTDDEDYVLETYERVPVERLRDQAMPAHRVGLLVFDTEPDMVEFFYGNESDSEDEFPEDDEDENAENYYTTEYPDEDLEWDDELDHNAYHYVNQNASDLEEFDERDFDDDVWEKSDAVGGLPGKQQ